jgi:hypothetical protein
VSKEPHNSPRLARFQAGSAVVVLLALVTAALLVGPATAFGQATTPTLTPAPGTVTATDTPAPSPQASATGTAQTATSLSLSTSNGLPGASITANGAGFKPGETVDVSFNGQSVGSPTVNNGGTFSLSFTVPSMPPGQYGVLAKGETSGLTASTAFAINQGTASLSFTPTQAPPGTSLTVAGAGFQPGDTVQVGFNGPSVGTATADTKGDFSVTFTVPPTLSPGQYGVTATGQTSGVTVNATYTVTAPNATPVPTAAATATPATSPQTAPTIAHDDRYFSQTGYRIDNDEVWAFFQQYGGLSAFGYPVSRQMTFLGCPVQMFQRHIIQVCPGQGAALINLLDPEIFPYTQVNGSTFPAPDATIKNNTPQVGSPSYSADIIAFVNSVVPDTFNAQSVSFLQTYNTLGGLTIWGAPISNPQPDPANANFIYQRFQRGIMHYIAGQGTQSILLADYLKAIVMNKDVPPDLLAQSRETRFFKQYCPGQTGWLCRPGELPGTDLTFAFENG